MEKIMFRIIGQPINMRYIGTSKLVPPKESWSLISKVATFGLKHGYKAAVDAFSISKSTYYNYVRLYKAGESLKSKRPLLVRKKSWNTRIVKFIREIRASKPNIGKSKIKFYLDQFCNANLIKTVSTGTIQNIINSHKNKLRTKKSLLTVKRRSNVLRKPNNFKPKKSGECIALDSMEFRQGGKKMYIVVAQDEATGLLFAEGTSSHTSRAATCVLNNAHQYLPWDKFNTILTDNGSEFCKDFAKYIKQNNITHYHTYPRTPKQNAKCERVNRTIQEEFMIKYGNLLFYDIQRFNTELKKYLHWFNFKRVHFRFDNKLTPFQYHLHLQNVGAII